MTETSESSASTHGDASVLKPHRRIVELDSLRALAAISLVLFHLTHVYAEKYGFSRPLLAKWNYGAYGTAMFFVLSGFVNSMSLLRRGRPVDFVAARLIRIVPVFLIAIVANLLIIQMAPVQTDVSWGMLLANLVLLPKVLGYECLDPVMWTLQVEMLFYGVLVLMHWRGMLQRYLIGWGSLLVASAIICPFLDSMKISHGDASWHAAMSSIRHLFLLDYLPLFAIGFAIYMFKTGVGRWWQNALLIVAGIGVLAIIDHGKHNPVAIALIAGLVAACGYGRFPILRIKPLLYISTISYSLYLFHNNFGSIVIYRLDHNGVPPELSFFAAIALAWGIAVLVTNRIEAPLTKFLRSRWDDYRSPQVSKIVEREIIERNIVDDKPMVV